MQICLAAFKVAWSNQTYPWLAHSLIVSAEQLKFDCQIYSLRNLQALCLDHSLPFLISSVYKILQFWFSEWGIRHCINISTTPQLWKCIGRADMWKNYAHIDSITCGLTPKKLKNKSSIQKRALIDSLVLQLSIQMLLLSFTKIVWKCLIDRYPVKFNSLSQ